MTRYFVAAAVFAVASGFAPAAGPPSAITVRDGMFADSLGMTLYTTDGDRTPNASSCYDNCVHNWPALNAADSDRDDGDWNVILREDGTRQWAYKGKPVYRFILDRNPGDVKGDGVGNVWHAIRIRER